VGRRPHPIFAPVALLTMMVTVVSLVTGCGNGLSRQGAITSFQEANPDASPEQASCVVDELIDRYSLDQLEVELAADFPDAGFEESQFRAMFRCGVVGDVEHQVTEQLAASGVDDEHAPCVADALVGALTDEDIDVLLSGQITEAFSTKFYQAMDDCDALDT
jgi:hypothetical protein